jgi:hypothetical protein
VRSRLSALANTLDSRGWAVKNVNTNLFGQPGYLTTDDAGSDRLVAPAELPQDVPMVDVLASDDILDASSNTTAQNLDRLVQESTAKVKAKAASRIIVDDKPLPSAQDYWFMNKPSLPQMPLPQDFATFSSTQVVAPGTDDAVQAANSTAEEEALAHRLSEDKKLASSHVSDHMKVLKPLHDHDGNIIRQEAPVQPPQPAQDPTTPSTLSINPAVQVLSRNDDLNISTLSREANRIIKKDDDDEVTISLR